MRGMRVSRPMLWRLSAGILVLVWLLLAVLPASADTGTYRITNYAVTLQPQSDGQVKIKVTQHWQVTGGDIPWITVGLPNAYFSVQDYSGAASSVAPANDSGFSGVRIDLNKDYTTGQDFDVTFSVLQQNILERLTEDKKWRISYTPGWYDRATIDHLRIDLVSPINYQEYSLLSPPPITVNDNILTWEQMNLSPGGRYTITLESSVGNFLAESVPVGTSSGGGGLSSSFYIVIAVIVAIGLLIFWGIHQNRKVRDARIKEKAVSIEEEMAHDKKKKDEVDKDFEEYVEKKNITPDSQGRYYDHSYGNYITPAIWFAILADRQQQQANQIANNSPRSSCVSTCACVSCACACACACAGGGAAGCSRKTLHRCRQCQIAVNTDKA